jgi:release factor glutamine methyltransferase
MMQTILDVLKNTEEKLASVTDSWHVEARMILCHVLKCEPIDLVFLKSKELTTDEASQIQELVNRRLNRYPLQYSLGVQNFYGLDFIVNESVLIPRPETECLVDYLVDYAKGKSGKLLDIGVGSGAIIVSLSVKLPKFTCIGVDISEAALKVSEQNQLKHGLSDRITLLKSDLFDAIKGMTFDVIVSNPPYIPMDDASGLEPEVVVHEPHIALFGGIDGLDFYRRIIPEALEHLNEGGLLAFEAGHDQCDAIKTLFKTAGYVEVNHFCDLNGIPRFIYGKKAPFGG